MARRTRTAIGYVRVSVDRDDKVSPDVQRRAITDYCEGKGWPLVDVVVERGKSAGRGKSRPLFDDTLTRLVAGEASALVVYKLDRMTRSAGDFAKISDTLTDAGAEFVSVTEGFDTTTAIGRGMVRIAAVFAEIERETIAERMRGHYRHQRAEGKGPNGVAPYGYRHDEDGCLEVDPDEAKWITEIAAWIRQGVSLRQIATRLTDQGAPPPRKSKGRWRYGSIRLLIMNPHLAGLRHDPDLDQLIDAPWEPILERGVWEETCAVLSDPARRTSHEKQRHLLSGIVTCAVCGTPMRPQFRKNSGGTVTRRYRCISSSQHPNACAGPAINADDLEAHVTSTVLDLLAGVELPDLQPDRDDELGEIDAQLDELAAAWGRGEISRSEWRSARSALVDRRDTLDIRPVSPTVVELASARDIAAAWPLIDLDAQRAVLRDLFDMITVGPSTIRGDVAHRVSFDVSS